MHHGKISMIIFVELWNAVFTGVAIARFTEDYWGKKNLERNKKGNAWFYPVP